MIVLSDLSSMALTFRFDSRARYGRNKKALKESSAVLSSSFPGWVLIFEGLSGTVWPLVALFAGGDHSCDGLKFCRPPLPRRSSSGCVKPLKSLSVGEVKFFGSGGALSASITSRLFARSGWNAPPLTCLLMWPWAPGWREGTEHVGRMNWESVFLPRYCCWLSVLSSL